MRSSNYWIAGLGLVAAAGLTYYIIKEIRKSEREIENQDKETKKNLESVGVSTETLKENNVSLINSDNLIQEMHKTISTSTNWDLDLIDPEKVLSQVTIVHVAESDFNNKKQIDFVFELPNITESRKKPEGYNVINSSYRHPKIKDFKLAFDKAADDMAKFVGSGNFKPFRKLEAYVTVKITAPSGNAETFTKRVPSEWYADKKNDANDGVVAFYGEYFSSDEKITEKVREHLKQKFIEDFVSNDENSECVLEVVDLFLGWRISFQERMANFRTGIDLISGLKCLKYITEEFSVKRDGRDETAVFYKGILFHEPGSFSELSNSFYNLEGETEDLEY